MKSEFCKEALQKFSGCDNIDYEAGTPENPAIWLLGIEHGTFNSIHDGREPIKGEEDYSIDLQLTWNYNKGAFKFLAAMDEDYGARKFREFARDKQPFVLGSSGFFKGNLYPFPCNNIGAWDHEAQDITGAASKIEYQNWCKNNRIPKMKHWLDMHRPKLVIGVGISSASEFSQAFFGEVVDFEKITFEVNGHFENILKYQDGWKKLIIVPHFTGGPNGLNSYVALQTAGELAKCFLEGR